MWDDIVKFWFEEIDPSYWWKKDGQFDETINDRFGALHSRATACELSSWRTTPEGRLAEVIILDQFSRNIYRDTPMAFSQDALALALAQEAISSGDDLKLTPIQRSFLYMPFMHSESIFIHEQAMVLFEALNIDHCLEFEIKHKAIIDRFGRYPHRNQILSRESTAEELAYLKQPGGGF